MLLLTRSTERHDDGREDRGCGRALCKLDGRDPDQNTALRGGTPGFQRFEGKAEAEHVPLWTAYAKEAERFVVAAEALQPLLARRAVDRW